MNLRTALAVPALAQTTVAGLLAARFRVRATDPSMCRSAKSLITQPAERITMTPATKTRKLSGCGRPAPAIHRPQSVGQSSSQVPTGLSSRMSRAYWRA